MPGGLDFNIRYETRLCKVKGELGLFHCWEHWTNVIGASALRGGHTGGQVGQVYGIVEFKDGVRRVEPTSVHFCDETNVFIMLYQYGVTEWTIQQNILAKCNRALERYEKFGEL